MYKLVVAGAGCGSINVVSQVIKSGKIKPSEIAVIAPDKDHFYQPAFTLIAGGIYGPADEVQNKMHKFIKPTKSLFHPDVNIIQKYVTKFMPDQNKIEADGQEISYENLVCALGINMDYGFTPGVKEALDDPDSMVSTVYELKYALKMNQIMSKFKTGKAVYTEATQPIKCAGAPQKIMYLCDNFWRQQGCRDKISMSFFLPLYQMFASPYFAKFLVGIAESKNILINYGHVFRRVDYKNRIAVFEHGGQERSINYDLLHVCPQQTAPKCLHGSPLSDQNGFVRVDGFTLRHVDYDNVWALGDCTTLLTSKTATAAIDQAPVLVHNLLKSLDKNRTNAKYTGYTGCPLFISGKKGLIAEFKYEGIPDLTYTTLQLIPNHLSYLLMKEIFPRVYFGLMPKAMWYGRRFIFPPNFDKLNP